MGNLRDMCKKKPCKPAVFSIGALLGNLEGLRSQKILREKEN
jgi:hypothetical protein